MPELIQSLVLENLRRVQGFDTTLKTAGNVDTIAQRFTSAILFEKNDNKRRSKINDLVSELVEEADKRILPQGQKLGEQNAKEIIAKTPTPKVDLNDAGQRGAALFRQKLAAKKRVEIVRNSVEANGSQLDKSLTKYWLEPSEGNASEKAKRLETIHNGMEEKRKRFEEGVKEYNAGERKSRPAKPDLDFMSRMTTESKSDIRVQARRTGTDAEIAMFQARGHKEFVWVAPNGIIACPDCINRVNVVLTMAQWESVGRPGSGQTICGMHCFCMLLPRETVAAAPLLLTARYTVDRGPVTDAATLAFLNANKYETTPAGTSKVAVGSLPIDVKPAASKPAAKPAASKPEKPKLNRSSAGYVLPNEGVKLVHKGDEQFLNDKIKAIFGNKNVGKDEVAGLLGMPKGSTITFGENRGSTLMLEVTNPEVGIFDTRRQIYRKGKKIVIENESFHIEERSQGQGIGTRVLTEQVEAARALGIDSLQTYAARSSKDNGYYTWARLGYTGKIPPSQKLSLRYDQSVPLAVRKATTVEKLMQTKEGTEWWKTNGGLFEGKFKITKDESSISERVLNGYNLKKQAKGK